MERGVLQGRGAAECGHPLRLFPGVLLCELPYSALLVATTLLVIISHMHTHTHTHVHIHPQLLFHSRLHVHTWLLTMQCIMVAFQIVVLLRALYWFQTLSMSVFLTFNYFVLYKLLYNRLWFRIVPVLS